MSKFSKFSPAKIIQGITAQLLIAFPVVFEEGLLLV
jgi:hypothetical protein